MRPSEFSRLGTQPLPLQVTKVSILLYKLTKASMNRSRNQLTKPPISEALIVPLFGTPRTSVPLTALPPIGAISCFWFFSTGGHCKNSLVRKIATTAGRHSLTSHGNMAYLSKCSSRELHMEKSKNGDSRGALIVLEGLDRCGKTSQCGGLLSCLEDLGHPVEAWRFPDRNTGVGQMISSYLANQSHLDDHAIHLLFSANRWEKRSLMESKLRSGTTLIVDRYAFSGVAFSSAKGLNVDWCKASDAGLLAPDLVVYLDISPEKAAERGGYGGERYEQLEFQRRVAQSYKMLFDPTWKVIDAALSVEDVAKQVKEIVVDCVLTCQKGKPLLELWQK